MSIHAKSKSARKPVALTIHQLREQEVILDQDLASLYGIPTRTLNMYVKRHASRFPPDFAFQLTDPEWKHLRRQVGPHMGRGGRRYRPRVFTEQGVMMVASILRGPRAVAISIAVLRAFARGREDRLRSYQVDSAVFTELNRLARKPFAVGDERNVVTYFIQAGPDGLIKIGVTTRFDTRFRALQMSSPVPLRILGTVPKDIEDYCHVALSEWRVHGEWFRPAIEVLEFIDDQLPSPPSIN